MREFILYFDYRKFHLSCGFIREGGGSVRVHSFFLGGGGVMLVLGQAAQARCINYRMFRYYFVHYERFIDFLWKIGFKEFAKVKSDLQVNYWPRFRTNIPIHDKNEAITAWVLVLLQARSLQIIESFRLWDENDCEYGIFSILSIAPA